MLTASQLWLRGSATPEGIVRPIAEGFFTDKMPPAVRAIWPSVYAFVCEGETGVYTATAFLVGKVNQGKRATYFFVTAGHAIEDCRSPRRYLAENVNQGRFESDGITIARPPQRLDGVQTVYVDDAYDIAVVKVEVSAQLADREPVCRSATNAMKRSTRRSMRWDFPASASAGRYGWTAR